MSKKRYRLLVVILGALTALAPFSIDTYLPAFPAIAKTFGITTSKVTLSLSSFFLGIASGQILYGPMLDRFDRKRPLYAGLLLYLISTIGCYLSPSIEVLVGFRFLQAIGSCAAGVVAMAMVRDLFPVKDSAGIFSLLMLVMGASPMIAPTLGGFISAAFGWRAIFIALFILSVIILLAAITLLPESGKADPGYALKISSITRRFIAVLRVPQFFTYALAGGIALSAMLAFIASSPTIFMVGYGVSNKAYGWIFALETLGFIGLSQFTRLFSKFLKPEQIVIRAVAGMTACSSLLLCGSLLGWFGIFGTGALIFFILGCIGVLNPNAAALAMAPFENNAGTAASLYGSIQWGIAGLVSIVISAFKSTTAVPLAAIMAGTAILSLIILLTGRGKIELPKQYIINKKEIRI